MKHDKHMPWQHRHHPVFRGQDPQFIDMKLRLWYNPIWRDLDGKEFR